MERQSETQSGKHPIQDIMNATMENIRDMVDVNTVIGDAVNTPDGSTVIPISRVCFGFIAGGGEYPGGKQLSGQQQPSALPFAGGSSAGVTVQPMGFLVVNKDQVKMLPAQHYAPIDRAIELVPQIMTEIKRLLSGKCAQQQAAGATQPVQPTQPLA